jgi:hypothetical protein
LDHGGAPAKQVLQLELVQGALHPDLLHLLPVLEPTVQALQQRGRLLLRLL